MFDKLGVKIIGLVDNMSFFKGEDGKKYPIFGEGGVKRTAEEFSKEFLCEIPIDPEVGKSGDQGKPIVESNPDNDISKIYLDIGTFKISSASLNNFFTLSNLSKNSLPMPKDWEPWPGKTTENI